MRIVKGFQQKGFYQPKLEGRKTATVMDLKVLESAHPLPRARKL
jgi:hypothetical protein